MQLEFGSAVMQTAASGSKAAPYRLVTQKISQFHH
jgi:hypothetical protein